MPYYLTPEQDDFNKIPELQVCIAEALYDSQRAMVAKLNKRGVLTRAGSLGAWYNCSVCSGG